MANIKEKHDFLSAEECDFLIWMAECQDNWDILPGYFWDNRTIDFFTTLQHRRYSSPALQRLSMQIYRKKQEFVSKFVGKDVNVDFMVIMRLEPGVGQEPHVFDGAGLGRVAGSAIFLNDNFRGGETIYPHCNRVITPKTGTIYVSGADEEHIHGIAQVFDNTRYVIISTWTDKPLSDRYADGIQKMSDYLNMCDQAEMPAIN